MKSASLLQVPILIGLIGTGFIARGFASFCRTQRDVEVRRVLTRRHPENVFEMPGKVTTDIDDVIANCDMVVECSGDVLHAANVVEAAQRANIPVVTMNAEFHATCGSAFVGKGFLTEAEGDQPGCIASLAAEAVEMGFRPLVYGNVKGFLNHRPAPEEMDHWARRNGISIDQVTSFTDGTKVQIEQALVANGLGADIARPGLLGLRCDLLNEGAEGLARHALDHGFPISDYLLTRECPGGVFVVASHDAEHASALEYFKLGKGPFYTLTRPRHLCYLEMAKSIRRAMRQGLGVIDNSTAPSISVASIAKRDLRPGDRIERGTGSFDVRGECVRILDLPGHVPIGLLRHAVITRPVASGDLLTMADVELPDSLAFRAWRQIENAALNRVLKRRLPLAV